MVKERSVGTYGFAQFQIDTRKADDVLERAVDTFKRKNRSGKNEQLPSDATKTSTENCEQPKE